MKFRGVIYLIFAIVVACVSSLKAAQVDSIYLHSQKMQRDIAVTVILPDAKSPDQLMPVVYMLHGHSGNDKSWFEIRQDMADLADRYQIIFVCPYGENSWYWDSPVLESSYFETFVSRELPQMVDSTYPTIASREGRAITGYSMGGHGALWNAMRNSDMFGAAGSMSGGLDIRPFPNNWDMSKALGEKEQNPERWDQSTCITQIEELESGELTLIIDCGADDFFIEVNNNFHNALLERGIEHDYIVRAGAHTAAYWANAIYYQLFFFNEFFSKIENR